jgi:hypothetical protein
MYAISALYRLFSLKFFLGLLSLVVVVWWWFACDILINSSEWYFPSWQINWVTPEPGDVICLEEGTRPHLLIKNIHGDIQNPIVIRSAWSQTFIDSTHTYGFVLWDSSHVVIDGSSSENQFGLKMRWIRWFILSLWWTHDVVVRNVEFLWAWHDQQRTTAIELKSDPRCESPYYKWNRTLRNVQVYDNYMHDLTQWVYAWYTRPYREFDCWTQTIMSHTIENIDIFDNTFDNIWQDAIQVTNATSDCTIYNNVITNTALNDVDAQWSAITVWWWSSCDVYSNIIRNSIYSPWILFFWYEWDVYDNFLFDIWVNRHNGTTDWIFVDDRSDESLHGRSVNIYSNTMINVTRSWIRYANLYTRNNVIADNLVILWRDIVTWSTYHWTHDEPEAHFLWLEYNKIDRTAFNQWKNIQDYVSIDSMQGDIDNVLFTTVDSSIIHYIDNNTILWVNDFLSQTTQDVNVESTQQDVNVESTDISTLPTYLDDTISSSTTDHTIIETLVQFVFMSGQQLQRVVWQVLQYLSMW